MSTESTQSAPELVFEEVDANEAGAFLALSYEEEPRLVS